jgi:hypothetical protein
VSAVDSLKRAGYTVAAACQAIAFSRSGYYASRHPWEVKVRVLGEDELELITKIKELKGKHPFWGYRRVWVWLRHREETNGVKSLHSTYLRSITFSKKWRHGDTEK